jgi:hypothetical protein
MCKRFTINGIAGAGEGLAGSRTDAARILTGRGWERTRAWGWICSTCFFFPRGVAAGGAAKQKRSGLPPAQAFEEGRKILEELQDSDRKGQPNGELPEE